MNLGDIANFIVNRRDRLKITQQDLSDLSGVSLRTVKSIEKGNVSYAISNLQKIANALGMEVELVIKKMSQ